MKNQSPWKYFKDEKPVAGSYVEIATYKDGDPNPVFQSYTGITEAVIKFHSGKPGAMWRLMVKNEGADPYGIPNVNFTVIEPGDTRWEAFKKQRLDHGFDESETWNLDATIIAFTLPRLKEFRECHGGYPACYTGDQWNEKLDDMIYWMENYDVPYNEDVDKKRMVKGKKTFFDEFSGLWW